MLVTVALLLMAAPTLGDDTALWGVAWGRDAALTTDPPDGTRVAPFGGSYSMADGSLAMVYPSRSLCPPDNRVLANACVPCAEGKIRRRDDDPAEPDTECMTPVTMGCTDSVATNFEADATDDDGSCTYGCATITERLAPTWPSTNSTKTCSHADGCVPILLTAVRCMIWDANSATWAGDGVSLVQNGDGATMEMTSSSDWTSPLVIQGKSMPNRAGMLRVGRGDNSTTGASVGQLQLLFDMNHNMPVHGHVLLRHLRWESTFPVENTFGWTRAMDMTGGALTFVGAHVTLVHCEIIGCLASRSMMQTGVMHSVPGAAAVSGGLFLYAINGQGSLSIEDSRFLNNGGHGIMGQHVGAVLAPPILIRHTEFRPYEKPAALRHDNWNPIYLDGSSLATCADAPCALGQSCEGRDGSLWCTECREPLVGVDGRSCTPCEIGEGPNDNNTACESCGPTEYGLGTCQTCVPPNVVSADGASCGPCIAGQGPNADRSGCDSCVGSQYSTTGICHECAAPNIVELPDLQGMQCRRGTKCRPDSMRCVHSWPILVIRSRMPGVRAATSGGGVGKPVQRVSSRTRSKLRPDGLRQLPRYKLLCIWSLLGMSIPERCEQSADCVRSSLHVPTWCGLP